MARSNEDLREQIREVLPEAIEALQGIILNPNTGPTPRIKAFEALANRGGLPAVNASVSQNISATMNPKELLQAKEELLREQEEISSQIHSIRGQLKGDRVRDAKAERLRILPQPQEGQDDT